MSTCSSCSSCTAAIIWATTAAGKPLPVDAAPCADGNIALEQPGAFATYLRKGQVHEGPRYKAHFATCPHAAAHRRPR